MRLNPHRTTTSLHIVIESNKVALETLFLQAKSWTYAEQTSRIKKVLSFLGKKTKTYKSVGSLKAHQKDYSSVRSPYRVLPFPCYSQQSKLLLMYTIRPKNKVKRREETNYTQEMWTDSPCHLLDHHRACYCYCITFRFFNNLIAGQTGLPYSDRPADLINIDKYL